GARGSSPRRRRASSPSRRRSSRRQASRSRARNYRARMSERTAAVEGAELRGHLAVEALRADPGRLAGTEVGAWFDAGWKRRIARRALVRLPRFLRPADVEVSAGVRAAATPAEWRRWTGR